MKKILLPTLWHQGESDYAKSKYYYLHFLYLYLLLVMLKIRMILPRLFSLICQPNSCLLTQDSF